MNFKKIELGGGGRQAATAAAPDDAIAAPPQDLGTRKADQCGEEIPPLYPEDLADLDEFDFGGAAFGRQSGPLSVEQSAITAGPLNARDLPHHQKSGLRFVEPRRLPLRRRRPSPPAPRADIAPRPLPLRKHSAVESNRGK